jgi:hypothetical protein
VEEHVFILESCIKMTSYAHCRQSIFEKFRILKMNITRAIEEAQIAKELKITPILDRLLEYKRNWIQHVNRMPYNRLPRVMKRYSPTGRRNHGRPLKRLLDT